MDRVFDIDAAKKFQQNKLKKQQEALDVRFKGATRDFDAICQMIIRDFQPTAIYQWGSLLDRKKFSGISDIDIAVEGITDAQDYFTLLRRADEMTEFPVDIVQLEKIHPLHCEMIIKKGVQIYRK